MTVKRPIAGNYNDQQTMRKTLSGKADSVFAYRSMNPYSVAFDKFKREANENFDEDLWQKAASKGELDQYINLLMQNPTKSSKLSALKEQYGGNIDYDTAMLALSYDAITDDTKEDRFDTNGNLIGNMTQRELIDKVLENQAAEWDKQILADELASANFWQKIAINIREDLTSGANKKPFLAEGGAFSLDMSAGAIRVWNMMQTTVAALSFAGGKIASGEIPLGMPDTWEQISKAYALAVDPKTNIQNSNNIMGTAHLDKIEKDLATLAFDIRRKYSYSIDPATGEYKFWGKILHGMADSIGFMALSMLGGGPAAMYIPMFTQNVRENLQLTGYKTDYSKLMTNAAGKSAVEFAIEWSLGKVFGFTKLDKIAFGYADDATKIGAKATKAVTKGMTATTGQAIGHLSAQIAKDAFQEGLEEVLQDGSGMFIDYLYGDEYSQRGKDGATLENFGQAFIIGAATSIAIGGFSNLTVAAKTENMTAVGTDGLTYQLGKFQSMVYKEALATMASWQEIANDAKAKPQARLEAALKLEGVMATLGGLYQSLGVENMAKAETLLLEVQKYHDKKTAIKEKVAKGVYISDILTSVNNEVGGKKWVEAVNLINKATNNLQTDISLMQGTKPGTAYISFTRFLGDPAYQKKLANSGATQVEPVDITGETKEDADKIADDNIYGMLAKMGFNVVVRTDGRSVIVGEDIVVVPNTILDTDIQSLLQEVVAQKTIENIISNIDNELLRSVINVYESILGAGHSYSEAEVADMAIAALMFDKSFQLRMLLETKQNSNSWGTDQVIKFITELKKMVHKTYTTSTTEKTASGKPKRVLSKATNTVTERIVASLQDSLTAFNKTVAANVTYDTKTADVVLDKVVEAAIGQTNANDIRTDIHVRYGAILEAIKNEQVEITPEIKTYIHEIASSLVYDAFEGENEGGVASDIIDHLLKINNIPLNSKPSVITIETILLKTISKGSHNARIDLTAALSLYLVSPVANSKLYFIPVVTSQSPYFKEGNEILREVEQTFLGNNSVLDVLNNNFDIKTLNTALLDSLPNLNIMWDAQIRHFLVNRLIKQVSNNRFAITPNGTLIKIEYGLNNLKPEIANCKTTEELIHALTKIKATKKDKLVRLSDLFIVDLGPLNDIPVGFTTAGIGGYYTRSNKYIMLKLGKNYSVTGNFNSLFHEIVHAVFDLNNTDSRLNLLFGGTGQIINQLNNVSKDDIVKLKEYIATNFPIVNNIAKVYSDGLSNLAVVLYYLHFEENAARSDYQLYPYSALGFTTEVENNTVYMVAPNQELRVPIYSAQLPRMAADFATIQLQLLSKLTQVAVLDNITLEVLNGNSVEEYQNLALEIVMPYIETGLNLIEENNFKIELDNILNTWTKKSISNLQPALNLIADLIAEFGSVNFVSNFNKRTNSKLDTNEVILAMVSKLSDALKILKLKATNSDIMLANNITAIITEINAVLLLPLQQYKLARELLEIVSAEVLAPSQANSEVMLKSFNFGEYSLVKHTGRSYMLTKQVGNGRYLTQEVAMDTLLPIRPNQSPLIADQAQRDKMLFVIAKKTEVAKTKEPELLEPEKKIKPKEQKVVFQWGGWLVKEFDATHYIVSKDIDKTNDTSDETGDESRYKIVQVVSKKTLLPDTMLGATGKPVLNASERSNILDWIAHETGPKLLKIEDKDGDPDKDRWIYRPNLSDKNAEPMTKEAIEDFNESELADDVPGNVDPRYELGLTWVTNMAKFYKKYPSLRAWVEGMVEKTHENLKAFTAGKDEAISLLYGELYKSHFGIKNDYQKSSKELKKEFDDFLKTPIYFVRTQNTKNVDANQPLNSVSLGYDLNTLPIFGNKGDFVFYGSVLPTDLVGFLPNSYAEGILTSSRFGVNAPLNYNGTEKELRAALKAKLINTSTIIPAINAFEMPRNKRTYVQPSRAKKNSSLVNFYNRAKAKGRNLQMHDDVLAFVEGTSEHFNELSKFFQVRIQNGTLTRHDIIEYVATAKISTINEYTWKALLKYIYKNPALEAIGPNMIQFLIDPVRLEKLAIIARMTEDPDSLNRTHTVASLQKLIKDFNTKIKARDPEFMKAYEKAERSVRNWYTYDETGLVKDDWIMKENQIFPIFLSLYQGTLKSLNSIFSYAKVVSAKQEATIFKGEAGTEGHDNANANKTTKISSGNAAVENNKVGEEKGKGPYNWAAHVRENIFDYEVTGYMPEEVEEIFTSVEEMTDDQKFNLIYTYLYDSALNYIADRKPTEQEETEANNDVIEIMENMTDDQIYNTIRYILDEKIRVYQIKKAKEADSSEKDALTAPSAERKVLKDHLRNKINLLISKLAGSKVAYNNLPTELKPLIDFTPTKSKANVDAYTNLTNPELETLANTISSEITRINKANQKLKELEKTKATIAKKVEALHKKQQAIKEREAKVKAREQAIKEGKNLRGKINLTFDAKIKDQTFTITGPSQINPKLQSIFNRTWAKQNMSKVKYMDDSAQTVQNIHIASEFYKEHADDLGAMSLAEIEDITDWLIEAHINTSGPAKQTFEAIQFFLLAYVYNQTDVGKGLFREMNANLKQKLESHLKSIQTSAGTLLSLIKSVKDKLHPAKIITVELFSRFEYVLSDAEQDMIDKAFAGGNTVEITKVLHTVKTNALANLTPEKATALRKIAAIRGMSMVSSPMTWIRNITSNYMLSGLNRTSTKIANAFLPKLTAKTANTPTQYRLNVPVTEEVQDFIKTQFVESGFFDETLDQISKYNPSQVLRHKKAGEQDIIEDMLIHSIYNHFYSESMFDSKILNHIHTFLMKRLSDKNFVRAAAVRYLGKLLSETKHHLDANGHVKTGIDKEIMEDVANAFALATTDYMHSDNFFSHLERWLSQHSPEGWAFFKTIMPFATASWNWFKAAIKYSPIGLAQSIVRLTRLEKEIIKAETLWQKGESQIAPELTVYTLTRNLGSGVIGTIAFGFGAILAALGYVSLEDDDWGTPKLVVGNVRIDISSIFGSSSVLAGMAFIDTLNKKKFSMAQLSAALDDMLDPLVDGFFFTDLLLMDANSPKGWFEFGTYQLQSIALSFIPSMARYVSGVTYTGNYRANNFFQRAVARLPFLGQAFNVPKKVDIYTGDDKGTMWDIVHRLLPYFEIVTKSQNQTQTEMYGLNKEELNGTYVINGQSFKTSPAETARINKLYGELNADALTAFYANQTSYRVLTDANRYVLKRYAQMTPTEISNALDQIFSHNSEIAKISAWLEAGHTYYTNDRELFNMMRQLGYTNVYLGNKGFVD